MRSLSTIYSASIVPTNIRQTPYIPVVRLSPSIYTEQQLSSKANIPSQNEGIIPRVIRLLLHIRPSMKEGKGATQRDIRSTIVYIHQYLKKTKRLPAAKVYYTEGVFKRSQMFKNIKMERSTSKQ